MVAWLGYLPVPGLGWVATRLAPEDPLTRYHAWQGGTLVIATYVLLVLLGFLMRVSDANAYQQTIGALAGLLLLAAVVATVIGVIGAARGRYVRIRPVWDLLAAIRD